MAMTMMVRKRQNEQKLIHDGPYPDNILWRTWDLVSKSRQLREHT